MDFVKDILLYTLILAQLPHLGQYCLYYFTNDRYKQDSYKLQLVDKYSSEIETDTDVFFYRLGREP